MAVYFIRGGNCHCLGIAAMRGVSVLACEHARPPCRERVIAGMGGRGDVRLAPMAGDSYHPSHPRRGLKLAKEPALPKDIASLSFEDALKELEAIVQQLERGQVKLDEAISAYERGALLKRHCEQKLAEAKMKVDKIVFSADGTVGSQPADLG